MKFTKKEIIPIALIAIMFVFSAAFYSSPCFPEKVPSHWDIQGEIDAYSGKAFALFFPPSLALAFYLLITFLPLIDPLRRNYPKFSGAYFAIKLAIIVFLSLLYFYTIAAAAGAAFDIKLFIIPSVSLLLVVIGVFLPKIERNYFIGIRTPWALQDESVWFLTHRFGGRIFMAMGILSALSILAGLYAFWVFMAIVIIGSFVPIFYSYFVYRKMGLFNKQEK